MRFDLSHWLTASRRVLPALNEGAFEAAMAMLSPVRGLRPWRARARFGREGPEAGDRDGLSLPASASAMVENTALTAASAPTLYKMDAWAATRAASWALVMRVLLWRLAAAAYHATDHRRPWHLWRIGVHSRMDRNGSSCQKRRHRVSGRDGPVREGVRA